jgi:hypothetical protein
MRPGPGPGPGPGRYANGAVNVASLGELKVELPFGHLAFGGPRRVKAAIRTTGSGKSWPGRHRQILHGRGADVGENTCRCVGEDGRKPDPSIDDRLFDEYWPRRRLGYVRLAPG